LSRSASRPCTSRWRRSAAVAPVRKWLWWALQLVVAGVVARMVWVAIVKNWSEFRSLHVSLAPRPGWIALSALVVFVTYAIQVESWRRVLAGWAQRLSYGRAARIWLVVNLGRYIPGKVWSVAGLVVLAQRAGVETRAAGAAGVSRASWVSYGVAVWLVARGLGLPGALPVARAAGVFALGYILGLLALFAPGGVGVREVVLIGLLTPALGGGGAVALSLASRILLTLTEVAAPLGALLITRAAKEDVSVRT